jgi:hypothetical protein
MKKKCNKCLELKDIDLFNNSKKGLYGKRGDCKDCQKNYNSQYGSYRYKNDESHRQKIIQRSKEWSKNNPEKRSVIAVKRNKKEKVQNPEKTKARQLVNQRVRFGRMPKANELKCDKCENMAQHYHHYKGYSFENRYDVIPLCIHCHKNEHNC